MEFYKDGQCTLSIVQSVHDDDYARWCYVCDSPQGTAANPLMQFYFEGRCDCCEINVCQMCIEKSFKTASITTFAPSLKVSD